MSDKSDPILLQSNPNQSPVIVEKMNILVPLLNAPNNLSNVQDFSNVCRTCATITEFVMPIFSGEGLQNNLADKIKRHLPIQVHENDELPLVVCYQCSSTLLAWHELVKCSIQADAALRAKISSQQKTNPPNDTIKSSSNVEEEAQSKLKPEFSRPQPEQYRTCVYCASTHPVGAYRKHLVIEHSHRLFHCEECNTFVDRKDFVVHMSFHALNYTGKGITRKKFKNKEDIIKPIPRKVSPIRAPECLPNAQSPQCPPKTQSSQCAPKTANPQTSPKTHGAQYLPKTKNHTQYAPKIECKPMDKTDEKSAPAVLTTKTNVQENDFSDHSDIDGFEPLPESVFKAIEDSQDGQDLANNTTHTPENQPHNEEAKIYSQSEINPLSTLAPDVEKKYKYNNCSVVIEPININNCAQMNIAIKNTKLNLALPDNKTLPKTTDASISDKHPPDRKAKRNQNIRKCPFCPKECRAASSYYYHLKYSHKESKEHKCEVCGRKFNTRSCLTQHMATHAAHYDYECQQCPKQFKTKAGLYIHEQTHSGKKMWSCSQCNRAFRWKTQLQRHMKRHAAEKDNVCETCGRGFNVRSDLLRHARTHTAGNFTCDKCGQKFAQLRYLKVHTKKQHSNDVKERKDSSNGTHTSTH